MPSVVPGVYNLEGKEVIILPVPVFNVKLLLTIVY